MIEPIAEKADPPLTNLRVLVVEDEMLVAMMVEDMLTELGCEVLGPASGVDKAIEIVRQQPVDGAVLDVNLGGEKVYPVAEELAARGIPFLFSTGYGVAGLEDTYRTCPTLQKPFREEDLSRMVRQVIAPARNPH